jgi:antitoxin component of MazEF toxin-antitoxin module
MRLHKVINRSYEGKVYYRWVLSIPPRIVESVGWVDGQELEAVAQESSLLIKKSPRSKPRRRTRQSEELVQAVELRNFARH